jgi:hypothetical protein
MDINHQIDELLTKYPTLSYSTNEKELIGELFITDNDSYYVRITLDNYPNEFPAVYETEERIPKKVERHIYTDSGSCCLTTRAKAQILLCTKVKTLSIFIQDVVIPYFQNNSYFEINKKYKTDEYSHNGYGIIEGYKDILQTNNDLLIAQLMAKRIEGQKLKIQNPCYCGSGAKMKKCSSGKHDQCYREFKMIDKELLTHDLRRYFIPHLKAIGLIKQ